MSLRVLFDGGVEVSVCSEADLGVLRSEWPTSGDVAESHYQEQASGHATFLCAWHARSPLGWCVIRWDGPVGATARRAYADCAEVIHLQVREQARRGGVGTALLARAETLAIERGFRQLAVSVGGENSDAARLYSRLGYQRTGLHDAVTYSWVGTEGTRHAETKTSELLIKEL